MISNDKDTKYYSILMDQSEMAVRLVEALTGAKKPANMSNKEALDGLNEETAYKIQAATHAMAEYFAERMKDAIPTTEFIKHEHGEAKH